MNGGKQVNTNDMLDRAGDDRLGSRKSEKQ